MFNVALFVPRAEATLAIGFIFVVYFFNGHRRPARFPMDLFIFTGSVIEDKRRKERAGEYPRLLEAGALAALVVPARSDALCNRGHVIGTAGLTLGNALVVLILYAALR